MKISSLFYRLAYRYGRPRWDSADPRPELVELAQGRRPGRALDLGCGTGTDCIFLASQGWEATGVDFAPQAIAIARSRAASSGSSARFTAGDVTRLREAGVRDEFDLVFDIGCYHGIPAGRRDAYASEVAAVTKPGADLYLAGVPDPPPAWRLLGARGINAEDLRQRFGAYFDLVDEQKAGVIGRAGRFVLYHLLRRGAAAALGGDAHRSPERLRLVERPEHVVGDVGARDEDAAADVVAVGRSVRARHGLVRQPRRPHDGPV
jgi:SAM-dependent methyltransferase